MGNSPNHLKETEIQTPRDSFSTFDGVLLLFTNSEYTCSSSKTRRNDSLVLFTYGY